MRHLAGAAVGNPFAPAEIPKQKRGAMSARLYLEVRHGQYIVHDTQERREAELKLDDLKDLFIDPKSFLVDATISCDPDYLLPGTLEFNEALERDIALHPDMYLAHLWGIMAGCGLRTLVSETELDEMFRQK